MIKKGFNKYKLSSPIEGSVIYETRSILKAADKCYKELIASIVANDVANNEYFSIVDIDTKIEYNFKINI